MYHKNRIHEFITSILLCGWSLYIDGQSNPPSPPQKKNNLISPLALWANPVFFKSPQRWSIIAFFNIRGRSFKNTILDFFLTKINLKIHIVTKGYSKTKVTATFSGISKANWSHIGSLKLTMVRKCIPLYHRNWQMLQIRAF